MELKLSDIIAKLQANTSQNSDLEHCSQIIKQMGINPLYPIILVGGTNGKGSTCAYLSSILAEAGYSVGSFTSPHIFSYNERVCINNQPIDDLTLANKLELVANASHYKLGFFKTITLAAHLIFMYHNIEIAIIEVGIGGMNDVTNLFEPSLSIITTVDLDHSDTLGTTIEAIGLQKAGIARPYKYCIFGGPIIPDSLKQYMSQINAKFITLEHDFGVIKHDTQLDIWIAKHNTIYGLPYPNLRGFDQINNLALAITALELLEPNFPLSIGAIKSGIIKTALTGRFQVLPGQPQIILDVAHNQQAISHMLQNMIKLPFVKRSFAVFGMAIDKDVAAVVKLCAKYFDKWFIAPTNSNKSCTAKQLNDILIEHGVKKDQILTFNDIDKATKQAINAATLNDRIMCFGSFLVVEEAYKTIRNARD